MDDPAKKARLNRLFNKLDENGDGQLTKDEVVKGSALLEMTPEEAAEAFDDLDQDGSGTLSRTEAEAAEALVAEYETLVKEAEEAEAEANAAQDAANADEAAAVEAVKSLAEVRQSRAYSVHVCHANNAPHAHCALCYYYRRIRPLLLLQKRQKLTPRRLKQRLRRRPPQTRSRQRKRPRPKPRRTKHRQRLTKKKLLHAQRK